MNKIHKEKKTRREYCRSSRLFHPHMLIDTQKIPAQSILGPQQSQLLQLCTAWTKYSRRDHHPDAYRRRPRRPPFRRVESEGVGVTSSILPMRMPERARARRADWAPGPGVLVPLPICNRGCQNSTFFPQVPLYSYDLGAQNVPPVARILMCRALIPNSLQRAATSWAANIAA